MSSSRAQLARQAGRQATWHACQQRPAHQEGHSQAPVLRLHHRRGHRGTRVAQPGPLAVVARKLAAADNLAAAAAAPPAAAASQHQLVSSRGPRLGLAQDQRARCTSAGV